MSDIRPGDRVLVRFDKHSPCPRHMLHSLPLFQQVGVADKMDVRHREHQIVVRFPTIICPPFGAAWVDRFTASELVVLTTM